MRLGPLPLLADLLMPKTCVGCGDPLLGEDAEGAPLCPPCLETLVLLPEPRCTRCGRSLAGEAEICMTCRARCPVYDEGLPLYDYHGLAGRLVVACKLGNRPSLAPLIATLFEEAIARRWRQYTLVPVPPRRVALRERGWDLMELVTRCLARRGWPVCRALERGASLEQKTLDREARRLNAAKAYRLKRGVVAPREALLVDDVLTSGATAEACAMALKGGGSGRVAFLSLTAD